MPAFDGKCCDIDMWILDRTSTGSPAVLGYAMSIGVYFDKDGH